MGTMSEPRHELAELLAKREVSDELSAIVESVLADARAGLSSRWPKTMRVFELMADRLQADARMLHEAIDEIDALRAEVRRLRREILEARQEGRPPGGVLAEAARWISLAIERATVLYWSRLASRRAVEFARHCVGRAR